MKRFCFFIAALFLLTACNAPISSSITPASTPKTSATLNRGINFGNMLEAPDEGDWALSVQEEYFDLVNDAGFDFVRLPVRWNTHGTGGSIRDRPNLLGARG